MQNEGSCPVEVPGHIRGEIVYGSTKEKTLSKGNDMENTGHDRYVLISVVFDRQSRIWTNL